MKFEKGVIPHNKGIQKEEVLNKIQKFKSNLPILCKKHGEHLNWRLHTGNNIQCKICNNERQKLTRENNKLKFKLKDAKQHFEQAIKIDPHGSDGSAFTSLGSLYYQVPPWPIAYGDNDKAGEMLAKGLEINPDGIDANYFYGEFLFKRGELNKATEALKKALLAVPREGREIADEGRKKEINDLLKKIEVKK